MQLTTPDYQIDLNILRGKSLMRYNIF